MSPLKRVVLGAVREARRDCPWRPDDEQRRLDLLDQIRGHTAEEGVRRTALPVTGQHDQSAVVLTPDRFDAACGHTVLELCDRMPAALCDLFAHRLQIGSGLRFPTRRGLWIEHTQEHEKRAEVASERTRILKGRLTQP